MSYLWLYKKTFFIKTKTKRRFLTRYQWKLAQLHTKQISSKKLARQESLCVYELLKQK